MRIVALVLCFSSLVAAGPAASQGPSGPTLTLRDALARVAAQSPALAAGRREIEAADARVENAGLSPGLVAELQLENFAGTGALRGADGLETTLQLAHVLELGGRLARRRELAIRERDVAEAMARARTNEVLAEAAERFIAVASAERTVEIQREEARLADSTVAAVERRIAIGAAPRFELSRAQMRRLRARIRQRDAESTLEARRRELAASWGARAADFGDVSADLFALPPTAGPAELSERLNRNPDLATLAAETRVAAARVRLAETQRSLQPTVSAGLRRIEPLDDTALVAGISIPFGERERAASVIREAGALEQRAQALEAARRWELETLLHRLVAELEQARFEFESLRGALLDEAQSALSQVQRGFEQGRFTFQDLSLAQNDLLDARRDAVVAAERFHRLLVQIEQLTGTNAASGTD